MKYLGKSLDSIVYDEAGYVKDTKGLKFDSVFIPVSSEYIKNNAWSASAIAACAEKNISSYAQEFTVSPIPKRSQKETDAINEAVKKISAAFRDATQFDIQGTIERAIDDAARRALWHKDELPTEEQDELLTLPNFGMF